MLFDLFHSISDPAIGGKRVGPAPVVEEFLAQVVLAEELGMDTVWLAESHFSSETQKRTSVATIPHYFGEVGLNADSFQFLNLVAARTRRIGLGTGIHNIVGGSGGPIASADRVNFLRFINQHFWPNPRQLRIGVASGRFPYQNTPFGLVPRGPAETDFFPIIRRAAFLEALEIFLRLLRGEELASSQVPAYQVSAAEAEKTWGDRASELKARYPFPYALPKRWEFEALKLVPEPGVRFDDGLKIVLGSSDPLALELAQKFWDVDLFNLSFTPPDQIEALHAKLRASAQNRPNPWHRSRLPRTVLVFVDRDRRRAQELANSTLDTYIEAMRGTAAVPDKKVLLERALVGDAAEVRDQLSPGNPRRFHPDDRLMLWFEFNQTDGPAIRSQMRYFFEEVVAKR
jgi:alkanesulfonate monooxygenase SsuD/methylene tetrahydromethanopterin reductase-like flavin-dependent oxidoreductase (luciferase family)